jgi:ribosomal protein S12 methylthiotransferase accessory factor
VLRAAVDDVTGIVTEVVEIEVERTDPRVFVAAANPADITGYGYRFGVASGGSGAGLTRADAEAAAIGECLERYALAVLQHDDAVFGTAAALASTGAIAPDRWGLFAPAQRAELEHLGFAAFTPDTLLGWYPARNLTTRARCLVPACLVAMPYVLGAADRGEVLLGPAVSTGAACAPTRDVAIAKGICELVERDAIVIAWRNRLALPRVIVDPASRLHAAIGERFTRPGLAFELYLTALDVGLPSFFGILTDTRHDRVRRCVGGAAHPDPVIAARKTLLELTQGLAWMSYRVDPLPEIAADFSSIRSFDDRFRLYAFHDHMAEAFGFLADPPEVAMSDLERRYAGCPSDAGGLVELVAGAGHDVVALDVTPGDVAACGVSVVKVMIPGLVTMEGDHRLPFLGGRRWCELPVERGLRTAPLDPAGIHPFPHPYP